MICPHCNEQVPLTWKRYWGSPFGRHTCPVCTKDFKLEVSAGQIAIRAIFALPGALAGTLFLSRMNSWSVSMLFYSGYFFLILIPVDRMIDNRWRKSIASPPPSNA